MIQYLIGETLISYSTINQFRISEKIKDISQDLYCTFFFI